MRILNYLLFGLLSNSPAVLAAPAVTSTLSEECKRLEGKLDRYDYGPFAKKGQCKDGDKEREANGVKKCWICAEKRVLGADGLPIPDPLSMFRPSPSAPEPFSPP
ncbi:hypothetical protein AJ80_01635 [Polytolypa hystricis UAMH7299]|uniref:Uncharacterized protein n=1 Tax=Polytolypa hystricis (strain UAMH7299) TaxID=1447883 RepID=A0A2B7Z0C4_POLH7|nr:hypothetical protein AJ80_01635 [Polytolypa hystricis UAMH7299]